MDAGAGPVDYAGTRSEPARAAPAAITGDTWRTRWLVMLVCLYAAPGAVALRPITDPDVWWHLRTGEWIARHGAVPWTDPFSAHGAGQPWIAYSWLFEVALHALYGAFGLLGPLVYSTALALMVTAALHALVLRYEPRVTRAAALTAVGIAAMGTSFAPRSYLASMLLFVLVLGTLLSVRESRRTRHLLIVPVLFLLWANLHIQFVYGLLALALCGVESLAARFLSTARIDTSRALPFPAIVAVGAASLIATLVNPYHVHLHWSILGVVGQTGVYDWISELQAMDFRQAADWLVLALALGAAYTLGRHRSVEIFPTLLLLAAVLLSFRSRRDVWVVVIVSVAIVALGGRKGRRRADWLTWTRAAVVAASVPVTVAMVAMARDVSPSGLHAALARSYPVEAAGIVAAQGLRGPLFNTFDWGGYLIWRLPDLPVSMDGRTNVHGDARILRSAQTWLGHPGWASDPELAAANLVIGPATLPLNSLLRLDSGFTLLYEDDVAVVFVREPSTRRDRKSPGEHDP